MKFKKYQITRGKPELGFFHDAFNSDGSRAFEVPTIVEESAWGGGICFRAGVGGESFSTLKEAKNEVLRLAGVR